MIFYGTKATSIGKFQVEDINCAHCQTRSPYDVSVFGKYAHLYWIPTFPIGKVAVAECASCKRTFAEENFPAELKSIYVNNKGGIKAPIWHFAGLGIIGLLFLYFSFIA